jgi:hypothetical protein
MIVRYFHFVGIPFRPTKTYTPLVVNANAMLSLPVAREFFEAIPWGHTQIIVTDDPGSFLKFISKYFQKFCR